MRKTILCFDNDLSCAGCEYIAGCMYEVIGTQKGIKEFSKLVFETGYDEAAKCSNVKVNMLYDFEKLYYKNEIESDIRHNKIVMSNNKIIKVDYLVEAFE